uniref:Uncharacterized protein n=1 Tax=Micrurus surinamensis TaxID=129470 RepID=A0A2D4NNB5_MICSU
MLIRSSKKTKCCAICRGQLISQGMQQLTHTHTRTHTHSPNLLNARAEKEGRQQKILVSRLRKQKKCKDFLFICMVSYRTVRSGGKDICLSQTRHFFHHCRIFPCTAFQKFLKMTTKVGCAFQVFQKWHKSVDKHQHRHALYLCRKESRLLDS